MSDIDFNKIIQDFDFLADDSFSRHSVIELMKAAIRADREMRIDTYCASCDVCGRKPNVVIRTERGTFCTEHYNKPEGI